MHPQDGHGVTRPSLEGTDVLIVGDAGSFALAMAGRAVAIAQLDPGPSLERKLRSIRCGVVVVVLPSGGPESIATVAQLRRERPGIRAVLVDPADDPTQRLLALEAGFDEAMPHEVEVPEAAARIAIQLDRARGAVPTRLPVGTGVELDLTSRALRRGGRFVHLRPLEFRLLEELARAPGRPLSRAMLMDRAWGSVPSAGSRTIDVHIRWLREKVERDPDRPVHLLTVRGVGYQLEPMDPDQPLTGPGSPSETSVVSDG